MFARNIIARAFVFLGVVALRCAIALGGVGKYDVEVGVCPMEVEPFWVVFWSVVGLPVFWFCVSVFFAATGDL